MSPDSNTYEVLAEPPTISPMASSPSRSLDYYWNTIVLQVEDTLFRIPKYQLVGKSEIFDAILSLPQSGNKPKGSSDDMPIQLENTSKIDFERFLQILYPRDTVKPPELSIDSWMSILRLSSLWRMGDLRSNAIEHLTLRLGSISPIARILLGRKYSVAHWISSGCVDLAKREDAISLEEAGKIGLETALLIQHVRESLWKKDHRELNRLRIAWNVSALFIQLPVYLQLRLGFKLQQPRLCRNTIRWNKR
ncbi:hypothetical protein IW261DRAFT_792372 [Armillaria novae-zelandiae]|uniref:BTB domain-containing protein n=1 Tax=Armillaria novae-zelandiae TaxID=153914 RepID=A0AA39TFN2_9AGAR|nr:hypothetical protein IW261DRAFT_792372 [Armillaria novae-zelandiae]